MTNQRASLMSGNPASGFRPCRCRSCKWGDLTMWNSATGRFDTRSRVMVWPALTAGNGVSGAMNSEAETSPSGITAAPGGRAGVSTVPSAPSPRMDGPLVNQEPFPTAWRRGVAWLGGGLSMSFLVPPSLWPWTPCFYIGAYARRPTESLDYQASVAVALCSTTAVWGLLDSTDGLSDADAGRISICLVMAGYDPSPKRVGLSRI